MPFDFVIDEVFTPTLFIKGSNEPVMQLDVAAPLEVTTESYEETDRQGNVIKSSALSSVNLNFDMSSAEIDEAVLDSLFDPAEYQNKHNKYDIEFEKKVQARKHKKKRINKKWLKRYGYKTIIWKSKGWDLVAGSDNTISLTKNYEEYTEGK